LDTGSRSTSKQELRAENLIRDLNPICLVQRVSVPLGSEKEPSVTIRQWIRRVWPLWEGMVVSENQKSFCTVREVKHWNRLPRKMVDACHCQEALG